MLGSTCGLSFLLSLYFEIALVEYRIALPNDENALPNDDVGMSWGCFHFI